MTTRWQWYVENCLARLKEKPLSIKAQQKYAATALVFSADLQKLLITKRSSKLKKHPGEYSLPGGMAEKNESSQETALRELDEETGLSSSLVEPISALCSTTTPYGMQVLTWIMRGRTEDLSLSLQKSEVEAAYWLDTDFFLQESNCRIELWEQKNIKRHVYFWQYEQHEIWGITGEILANFFTAARNISLVSGTQLSTSRQQEFLAQRRDL